jgi:hypothetical protein
MASASKDDLLLYEECHIPFPSQQCPTRIEQKKKEIEQNISSIAKI